MEINCTSSLYGAGNGLKRLPEAGKDTISVVNCMKNLRISLSKVLFFSTEFVSTLG